MNRPLDLSANDRDRLTDAAIDRFFDFYPSLRDRSTIFFTLDTKLLIRADLPYQVDDLTFDAEWLKNTVYYVFGAIEVSIWFGGVEVWCEATKSEVISKESTLSDEAMTTATLDRTATEAPITPAIKELGAPPMFMALNDLTTEMGMITGRPSDEWRSQILNSNPPLFVSTSVAQQMIGQQIRQLQAVLDRLGSSAVASVERDVTTFQNGNGNQAPAATKPAAAKKPAATKPAAKRSHKKTAPKAETAA